MLMKFRPTLIAAILVGVAAVVGADDFPGQGLIKGKVVDPEGQPLPGIMISAWEEAQEKRTTVYSQPDGSFSLVAPGADELRARWIGWEDEYVTNIKAALSQGNPYEHKFEMGPAEDIQMQRRAESLMGMLEWDNEEQARNFRMMCTFCHQVGTIGFRTPEEPVDWEVMVTRMDGFGGLHKETQEVLVAKLLETYSPEAMESWPDYSPPPAAEGEALNAVITEWLMGAPDNAMIHDLIVGSDGLIYVVDMINDALLSLDTTTGERIVYAVPGGKEPYTDELPRMGPHSLQEGPNKDIWMTLALGGKMGKFDIETKEFTIVESGENNRRGFYPHTLRFDQEGIIWYTDAAMNSVFRLDPATHHVKRYALPKPEASERGRVRGEGGSITPYGIDVAPDGRIWYSKLNAHKIGVIDPKTDEIVEYDPPVHGPRRHRVDAKGIVWVPGYATGDLARFDPATGEWKVYPLPGGENGIPYALNIHPTTGEVWVCGTGTDSMIRFNPETEEAVVHPMPTQVTYTREVVFDSAGNAWTCNSNYPVRHIEGFTGSVIRIAWQP
jgi:streptogramin lyase